jgi:DNA-binding transcriptional ArsR family regulator
MRKVLRAAIPYGMAAITSMARVAALVGDPARANMLASLMDGRAHTPTELALDAGISAATASGHLAQLLDGGLVAVAAQGRHRYYRLASDDVARMIEGIMVISAEPELRRRATPRVPADLREARTCYDHLAGRLAVAMSAGLVAQGHLVLDGEAGAVTESGMGLLCDLGIDLDRVRRGSRRLLCRPCLDWSERRPHLAGVLGAALFKHFLAERWIERVENSRAIRVTRTGRVRFERDFGAAERSVTAAAACSAPNRAAMSNG